MPTYVAGTLRTSSGEAPELWLELSGGSGGVELVGIGAATFEWQCSALGAHVLVELHGAFDDNAVPADEVFRVSRHLIESMVSIAVLNQGVGLTYSLEHCRRADGSVVRARPDKVPDVSPLPFVWRDLFNMVGDDDLVRFALRDFNSGLVDRENCPFLFYRAIESLAKVVTGLDNLRNLDWATFHSSVGTSRAEMNVVEAKAKRHRHGTREWFSPDEHVKMMKQARHMIERVIIHLMSLRSPAASSGPQRERGDHLLEI